MTPRRLAQLFTVVSGLATLLTLLFASLPARADEEAPITRLIEEWLSSPHGNYHSRSFTYWNKEGEVPTNCATCTPACKISANSRRTRPARDAGRCATPRST